MELSPEVKTIVFELYQEGHTIRGISELLQIPRSTVGCLVKRVGERGSVENQPRSGRPALITPRDYRKLERIVKVDRRKTLTDITNTFNENRPVPVARRTLQFHLHKHGYKRRVSKKKIVVREVNRKKRLHWCREKRRLTVENYWNKVIFSDESKIMIGHDQRVYVWRKRDEGWRPDLVTPRRVQPCYQVMIWGCITWHGVGTLTAVDGNINADKYQQILDENLWPVLARHFAQGQYIFQDDNAPVHRARTTQDFLRRNGIKTMSWPAQSPDINVIENIWLFIKRKLQMRTGNIKCSDDLFREIHQIWAAIPPDYVKCLYNSIPRRIMNVIRLKGHLTKY